MYVGCWVLSGADGRGSVKSLAEEHKWVGRDMWLQAAACAGHTHQTPGKPRLWYITPTKQRDTLQMTEAALTPQDI